MYFIHILQQNTKPVQYGCLHRKIQKPNKNIVLALMRHHNNAECLVHSAYWPLNLEI